MGLSYDIYRPWRLSLPCCFLAGEVFPPLDRHIDVGRLKLHRCHGAREPAPAAAPSAGTPVALRAPSVRADPSACTTSLDRTISPSSLDIGFSLNPCPRKPRALYSVRGPTHVVRTGKTPVLQPAEARLLLDTIDTSTLRGLRDRALLAVMVYSFARVSAVVGMRVEDYYQQGKRWWLRLQEKGGKHHAVPVHHKAEAYLDAYLDAAGIAAEKDSPLWRSMPRAGGMGARRMSRVDVFRMIKRRVKTVGLGEANCHTFRATGITAYLLNGGTLKRAQAIAAHESPRTTKLYDRTADEVTVEDIEKIGI